MLVETPAVNLSVDVRAVEAGDEALTLAGMAGTMPCKIVVSRQEIGQIARLLTNRRVIRFILAALLSKPPQ